MTRITKFCVVGSALAALALSANGASAAMDTFRATPPLHVQTPNINKSTGSKGATVQMRKAGGNQSFTSGAGSGKIHPLNPQPLPP